MTPSKADANVGVSMVRDRDFYPTLTRLFGRDRTRDIRKSSIRNACPASARMTAIASWDRASTSSPPCPTPIFDDCAYEEMLQALGPINDTDSVPWTMFNDNVQMGYFGVFDQYILNILYDPRMKPGMTAQEVGGGAALQLLADVRAWVQARE